MKLSRKQNNIHTIEVSSYRSEFSQVEDGHANLATNHFQREIEPSYRSELSQIDEVEE